MQILGGGGEAEWSLVCFHLELQFVVVLFLFFSPSNFNVKRLVSNTVSIKINKFTLMPAEERRTQQNMQNRTKCVFLWLARTGIVNKDHGDISQMYRSS